MQPILLELIQSRFTRPGVPVRTESRLVNDLGLDSMKILNLTLELERRLNFDVGRALRESDFAAIQTVGDLLTAVEQFQKP